MRREAKMIVNKSGSGSNTFRATLPSKWIREMGLNEDNRDLILEFNEGIITIMSKEKQLELLVDEFKSINFELKGSKESGYTLIEKYDDNQTIGEQQRFNDIIEVENELIRLKYVKQLITEDEFHNTYKFD